MYKVGDYVVRSADGLCLVSDIVSLDFVHDDQKKYYRLVASSDPNGKIYVPVETADAAMRHAMTQEQAQELIKRIPAIKESWIVSEKERQRYYKEAIQSNDPDRIIGIIKLIYQRKKTRQAQGKKTTAVDEQYFSMAENRLYSELEYALDKNRKDIELMIENSCEERSAE